MKYVFLALMTFFTACQSPSGSGPGSGGGGDPRDEDSETFRGHAILSCQTPSRPVGISACLQDKLRVDSLLYEMRQWPTQDGKWESFWLQINGVKTRHGLTEKEISCLRAELCKLNQ